MNGSIFTPPRTGDRKGKQAATASRMLSKAITAVYTIGSLVIICPPDMSSVIPLFGLAEAATAAAATARSVLQEVNQGASTPPLNSFRVPKLKSTQGGSNVQTDRSLDVLESVRRHQSFNSDDEI
ncbi:hypothetical protein SLEP1_g124 [Rubroshorea leprosula]|uniref:Uncharacterized protein n=1 Tax=Rubroshorea leprosula TaxID=152421 RepID=A0AAV5HIT3_9ROSI|nr:hypothetical protein SLEP1_g124 [Rubroshorea leprosula]